MQTGLSAYNIDHHTRLGEWNRYLFSSDIHLGNSRCDESLVRLEYDEAVENDAKITIFGDLFDGIAPGDPRFRQSELKKDLRNTDEMCDKLVQFAAEFLHPYRKNIVLISMGNHEDTLIKYYHSNLVKRLIEKMNNNGAQVEYGGYDGYMCHRMFMNDRCRWTFKTYYNHGTGSGGAPVTDGVIDFSRIDVQGVDFVALAHNHKKPVVPKSYRILNVKGNEEIRTCYFIRTGSYLAGFQIHDEEKDPSYVRRKLSRPTPMGGVWVKMRIARILRNLYYPQVKVEV